MKDGQNGLLEFPRGTYRVTRTILIDLAKAGRFAIHGTGGTAKLLMGQAAAGPLFEFVGHHAGSADPTSFKPEGWQSERMPTVSQIGIQPSKTQASIWCGSVKGKRDLRSLTSSNRIRAVEVPDQLMLSNNVIGK